MKKHIIILAAAITPLAFFLATKKKSKLNKQTTNQRMKLHFDLWSTG